MLVYSTCWFYLFFFTSSLSFYTYICASLFWSCYYQSLYVGWKKTCSQCIFCVCPKFLFFFSFFLFRVGVYGCCVFFSFHKSKARNISCCRHSANKHLATILFVIRFSSFVMVVIAIKFDDSLFSPMHTLTHFFCFSGLDLQINFRFSLSL